MCWYWYGHGKKVGIASGNEKKEIFLRNSVNKMYMCTKIIMDRSVLDFSF